MEIMVLSNSIKVMPFNLEFISAENEKPSRSIVRLTSKRASDEAKALEMDNLNSALDSGSSTINFRIADVSR